MRDYNTLITDLDDWDAHNGCKIGADGWLACMGSLNLAAAFTSLFWPEFEVYEDSVFIGPLSDLSKQNYHSMMSCSDSNLTSVEVTMNHQHILDIFPNDESATREQVIFIGRILKQMWEAKLSSDFPERNFTVSFPEDHADELIEYEITFWQDRPQN